HIRLTIQPLSPKHTLFPYTTLFRSDLTNDAIIVRDINDRITYWNNGATKIYGYRPDEALGKVSHNLLRTEFPEPLPEIYQKLLRDRKSTRLNSSHQIISYAVFCLKK